eukprot:CAMPEP_0175986952 /NCGR_PEP_ID=MMETSP0108-20121206/50431_1 /TAXON_ID=195067 ORGANISM="Goniomonas pacifica, Strain CCMP1869" /NCGR_SAMPLE_ID=MMETSP0108 /ASSEMBLY_ACC=CAM_ASM_000204 /LENGTH=102 /DNA_ID=CAMNT_0017318159 /DNA_START=475 /DNA_END=781 /DNA_ORIENTATION=-
MVRGLLSNSEHRKAATENKDESPDWWAAKLAWAAASGFKDELCTSRVTSTTCSRRAPCPCPQKTAAESKDVCRLLLPLKGWGGQVKQAWAAFRLRKALQGIN